VVALSDGRGEVRIIAGTHEGHTGPVQGIATDPVFFDVRLQPGKTFSCTLPPDHNAFLYSYEGSLNVGPSGTLLQPHHAGVLSAGANKVEVSASSSSRACFLLLAARPLGEPIVQHGPFVMNTREQIDQAFRDLEEGKLCE